MRLHLKSRLPRWFNFNRGLAPTAIYQYIDSIPRALLLTWHKGKLQYCLNPSSFVILNVVVCFFKRVIIFFLEASFILCLYSSERSVCDVIRNDITFHWNCVATRANSISCWARNHSAAARDNRKQTTNKQVSWYVTFIGIYFVVSTSKWYSPN